MLITNLIALTGDGSGSIPDTDPLPVLGDFIHNEENLIERWRDLMTILRTPL